MDIQNRRRDKGFTLVELMIAVAIIGILASVAIPSFRNYTWKSKRSEAYVNLGALASTQKAYLAAHDVFVGVAPAEPGNTQGTTPGEGARESAPLDAAFAAVGWAAEGNVYFDYDTNSQALGIGCACPRCFTATAYGDIDGDNSGSAVMYVHPDAAGNSCLSAQFGYTTPVDAGGNPIYDQVAQNLAVDAF
jgi:prepilin-type N-terminal cleavage/methylation domain-containing protein